MAFYEDSPEVLRQFLVYMESILGRSPRTVAEYYLDLRTFLRYIVACRSSLSIEHLEEVDISKVDIGFISSITQSEIYDYLLYISKSRDILLKSLLVNLKTIILYIVVAAFFL